MRYPVSEKRCKGCSMCQLVDRDFSFAPVPESEQYYQCLAMAEADCGEIDGGGKDD